MFPEAVRPDNLQANLLPDSRRVRPPRADKIFRSSLWPTANGLRLKVDVSTFWSGIPISTLAGVLDGVEFIPALKDSWGKGQIRPALRGLSTGISACAWVFAWVSRISSVQDEQIAAKLESASWSLPS
ncbi:hypothetical protein NA56DRAFT_745997 [Hyaloscypha hepaticicola]|uniref:Uncharacterized protein n=1 Tax=Hyaloscypha hepaticicola TaxID=2082293 RepID=A0A2J6QEB5_9HELO|nr:hypothetical protein NA56DRAFT_745997 [Hyaloscypha hepaticicola]